MLKWRTLVTAMFWIFFAARTVVAVVLVVYFKLKSQDCVFFKFNLSNMLLSDMDVGKNTSWPHFSHFFPFFFFCNRAS